MELNIGQDNVVGRNIRMLRQKHSETQEELGKIIGYGATTVANYESGYRLPDIITAYVIAKHYGVKMEDLLSPLHES